jgi:hypothetical protein
VPCHQYVWAVAVGYLFLDVALFIDTHVTTTTTITIATTTTKPPQGMTTVKVMARAAEVGLVKARARAMEKVVQVGEGAAAARGVAGAVAVEGAVEWNLNSTRRICT